MARFNSIFSVYYPDRPNTQLRIEAPDDRSAAEQFFKQHARSDDCVITVVPSGIFGSVSEFRTTDFMDAAGRAAAGVSAPQPKAPAQPPPTSPILERGTAKGCIALGILFLVIGAWFLIQPSTEMGRSFGSTDFPALVNLHRLYVGQTCCIVGAVFLAVGIRPR